MTVYNFNLGIGWASSGVEYAQSYRAKMLRNINVKTKFVFSDMIDKENIESLTSNIGFKDEEVIWLYSYFTDYKIEPSSYKLSELEKSFSKSAVSVIRKGDMVQYCFEGNNNFNSAYLAPENEKCVKRVEIVRNGLLIRTDHYTSGLLFSEYFAPLDGKAHLYLRRFFNRNGSLAYEEYVDGDSVMYHIGKDVFYSKEQFFMHFVKCLGFKKDDVVIIDRSTGTGQALLMCSKPASVGVVVHAEHFNEFKTDDENILWNNFYEYTFSNHRFVDFYIVSTDEQNRILEEQFKKFEGACPKIYTVPVGGLEELKRPAEKRKPYSLITASRLASEKHIDWAVRAVARVHEKFPDISFDIYGQGGGYESLKKLIEELGAKDYIKLCGQHNMDDIYQNYECYLSGSTSEGFGLSLLEAIGGGLPIVGFNVRYGNPSFVCDGQNGYLIEYDRDADAQHHIERLAEALIKLFEHKNLECFHEKSYETAKKYLTSEVSKQWKKALM